MAVYPKGNKFMASFGSGKNRVRATFPTMEAGEAWEKAQEAAAEASRPLPEALPAAPTSWTLQKALDHTDRHRWAKDRGRDKTLINANQALAFFGPNTPTSEITSQRVIDWVEELQESGNTNSTLNRKLSALSVMLKEAMDSDGLDSMPRIKRYDENSNRIRWFTDEDEQAMLAITAHAGLEELRDIILVGIDTGFRRSELLRLDSRDYQKGDLLAHADDTKNGRARAVPTTTRVQEVLERRFKEGRKLFPTMTDRRLTTQWDAMRSLLGRTDDPGFIVHVMRHTCATRLVAEGTPLLQVKEWMGHQDIATTMRYAHMIPGALRGAVDRLNARVPEKA
jgi:integrase